MKNIITYSVIGLLATTSFAQAKDAKDISVQHRTSTVQDRAYQYEFDRDEQCQGYYWGVKRLGIENPCAKDEEEKKVVKTQSMEVLSDYVVYFDFDESHIRDQDEAVLNKAVRDIARYNPSKVLVAGFTDTRGSMGYNEALSARRANAVSNYLNERGVSSFVVDEEAMGETNLAVPTGDEVKLQQNRRVLIQFIR